MRNETLVIGRFEPLHCKIPKDRGFVRIRDIKVKRKPRVYYLFLADGTAYEVDFRSGFLRTFSFIGRRRDDVFVVMDEKQRRKAERTVRSGRLITLSEWIGIGKSTKESYASVFSKRDPVRAYMEALRELDGMRMLDLSYHSLGRLMRKTVILKHKRKFGERKSTLEEYWRNVPLYTYSEVFAFERKGRIVSYDVNSMFPHALSLPVFSDPRKLRRYEGKEALERVVESRNGILRVRMRPVTRLGRLVAPVYYRKGGVSHQIAWEESDVLDVWLTYAEAEALKEDFEILSPIEGICSPRPFSTGLKEYIAFLYSKRRTENEFIKRAVKNALVYLHASYLGYGERKFVRGSREHIRHCERYGILPDGIYPFRKPLYRDDYGREIVSERVLNLSYGAESVFFTAVAHSRALLYSAVKKVLASGGEVCYVNVDSVHVRFEDEESERKTDEALGIGSEMGAWKKEVEADHGVWVDPGVYYLFKDGKPAKISIPFGIEKRERNPFQRFTRRYVEKIGKDMAFELFGSLRYAKSVVGNSMRRIPSSVAKRGDEKMHALNRWKENAEVFRRKHDELKRTYGLS